MGAVSDPTSAPSTADRRPAGVGALIAIAWLATAAWAVSAAVSLWRMLGGGHPDLFRRVPDQTMDPVHVDALGFLAGAVPAWIRETTR